MSLMSCVDHRLSLLMDGIAILKGVGGRTGIAEALEMRNAIESGMEPSRALVRSVDTALLEAVMSPHLLDAGSRAESGLLASASGVFFRRMTDTRPTREHVRRVYKEFVYAFRLRSTATNDDAASEAWSRRAALPARLFGG